MAMVLHELTTNAGKYGAFSDRNGRVSQQWRCLRNGSNGGLAIEWQEIGGPRVLPPSQRGYGTGVIAEIIPFELGGTVELTFPAEGVRCRMQIPAEWVRRSTPVNNEEKSRGQLPFMASQETGPPFPCPGMGGLVHDRAVSDHRPHQWIFGEEPALSPSLLFAAKPENDDRVTTLSSTHGWNFHHRSDLRGDRLAGEAINTSNFPCRSCSVMSRCVLGSLPTKYQAARLQWVFEARSFRLNLPRAVSVDRGVVHCG
jgi:hypothetical protein